MHASDDDLASREIEARRILASKRDPVEAELATLADLYRQLAVLIPEARARVLGYICGIFGAAHD